MGKLSNKGYFIFFIMSLFFVFTMIVFLHSYYNLKDILMTPSEKWGRTTSLSASNLYKKQPSVLVYDEYTEILAANKMDFTFIQINRETREAVCKNFKIKDVESYKVQQFEWDINNIYFIENNNLYFSSKNSAGEYSIKTKIADNINDFNLLEIEGKKAILAAGKNGIALYSQLGQDFSQISRIYEVGDIKGISSMVDKESVIHIAAFSETNSFEFPVYYITYAHDNWATIGYNIEKSLSEAWGINNIEIALDDTDTYIFYEMAKWDPRGISAKILYTVVPSDIKNTELKFTKLYLSKQDENNSNFFLSEPRTLKEQNNVVKMTVIKDTYDKKISNGFSGYIVSMDQGQIIDVTRTTLNKRFMANSAYVNYKDDDILVYLDAAGSFNYEAFYTETGRNYTVNAAKATRDDYTTAIMNTIPAYISTLLLSLIKFIVYFPVILWFLIIEFFEIKSLKEKPRLTFAIGILIYIAIKLITFGTYYTPLSMSQMPPILNFNGAYYFYAAGIAMLALGIEKLLKKHKTEMNMILEYIIFAIIDIQITNMLFAVYLI